MIKTGVLSIDEIRGNGKNYAKALKKMTRSEKDAGFNNEFCKKMFFYSLKKDKSVMSWGNTIRANFEDVEQEGYCIILDELQKLQDKHGSEYDDMDFRTKFFKVYQHYKSRLMYHLSTYYGSINHKIAVSTAHSDSADYDILERLDDKAQSLQIEGMELLESLKGSLSARQFDYINKWVQNGKKPYDNTRQIKAIRERLQDDAWTPDELQTALSYSLQKLCI